MGVIIRQSFKASISNYMGVVLGFASLFILFPLFFNPVELGTVRLFIELGAALSAFAMMGTTSSINRFFPYFKTKDQKHHGFFFWALLIPATGFLLLLIFLNFFGTSFFLFINENALEYRHLFPVLLCLILANIYIGVTEVSCANHGRIAVTNFSKEVLMRLFIIGAGSLYYFGLISFENTFWLIVCAYGMTMLINFIFLSRLTRIHLKPDFDFLRQNRKLSREILGFTGVLIFSAVSTLVIPKIDFFLVSKLQKDLSNVAIYSIGFNLAIFIEIPKRTILQIALPIISAHTKDQKTDEIERFHKKNGSTQLMIACLLFFLIWLNIDNLYAIMPRGEYYAQGKWVVFIIGLSKVADSVFSAQGSIISNSRLYQWTPFIVVMNGGFAILFNYYFISVYGYVGGAISNFAAMAILNLFCLYLISRKLRIHPFESRQIRIVMIFLVFLLSTLSGRWFANPYLDGLIRTGLLGSAYLYVLYRLRISEEFNELLKSKVPFLR